MDPTKYPKMPMQEATAMRHQSLRAMNQPENGSRARQMRATDVSRMNIESHGPAASEKLRTSAGASPQMRTVKTSAAKALGWVDCISS
jgi:hypothetical protein